ncbi:MAG: hypothetical protein Q8P68_03025 [Candidatus Peregrinibacteria bacterium]|nr:hypothetical protein [Candidatus Peregrinibacteria bacterium]MDZ4244706.1 hypothetical protein [Candidatus Gracilibacteria bacterium]
MQDFKKELKEAKEFYFNVWRGHEKPCPAFDGEVVRITRAGWGHIRFSENRDIKEIIPRLKLLKVAKRIIESQSRIVDYRQVEDLEYWALENFKFGKGVRVIIRSRDKKHKYFFSVFVKNKKREKSSSPIWPRQGEG